MYVFVHVPTRPNMKITIHPSLFGTQWSGWYCNLNWFAISTSLILLLYILIWLSLLNFICTFIDCALSNTLRDLVFHPILEQTIDGKWTNFVSYTKAATMSEQVLLFFNTATLTVPLTSVGFTFELVSIWITSSGSGIPLPLFLATQQTFVFLIYAASHNFTLLKRLSI